MQCKDANTICNEWFTNGNQTLQIWKTYSLCVHDLYRNITKSKSAGTTTTSTALLWFPSKLAHIDWTTALPSMSVTVALVSIRLQDRIYGFLKLLASDTNPTDSYRLFFHLSLLPLHQILHHQIFQSDPRPASDHRKVRKILMMKKSDLGKKDVWTAWN